MQRKFKNIRNSKKPERGESPGSRRNDKKKVTCFECNEPGQYKRECPKLQKEKPKKKFHKKKGLMATWDDSDSSESESDSEGKQANIALMATVDAESESTSESESDSEEVFSCPSREELASSLAEILEIKAKLSIKYKKLRNLFVSETKKLELENSKLREKVSKLSKDAESSSGSESSIPSLNNILKE